MDQKTEKATIEKCKVDVSNFSALYEAYSSEVFRYVRSVLKDQNKSEDITSQVFLVALEKIKDYEYSDIPFKYWLFGIARNKMLKSFKASKTEDLTFKDQ